MPFRYVRLIRDSTKHRGVSVKRPFVVSHFNGSVRRVLRISNVHLHRRNDTHNGDRKQDIGQDRKVTIEHHLNRGTFKERKTHLPFYRTMGLIIRGSVNSVRVSLRHVRNVSRASNMEITIAKTGSRVSVFINTFSTLNREGHTSINHVNTMTMLMPTSAKEATSAKGWDSVFVQPTFDHASDNGHVLSPRVTTPKAPIQRSDVFVVSQ